MFSVRFRTALRLLRPVSGCSVLAPSPEGAWKAEFIKMLGVSALLALSVPSAAAAQASGTMQASAHVVSADAAWSGLREAQAAVAGALRTGSPAPLVRRTVLVQTTTELRMAGRRRTLLVTVDHLRN